MNTTGKSEGPGAATPRPSEPIAHQNEQDKIRMTDHTPAAPGPDDEGYWAPVDSSGITQSAGIPEADLAKIVAATASHKSGDDLVRIEIGRAHV